MFKEGSMVVPGGVTFDPQYFAVQINPTHLGIDVGVYAQSFVGTRIRGQSTGVTAKVVNYITAAQSDKDYDTLYVKYIIQVAAAIFLSLIIPKFLLLKNLLLTEIQQSTLDLLLRLQLVLMHVLLDLQLRLMMVSTLSEVTLLE